MQKNRKTNSITGSTILYYYNHNWQVLCEYDGTNNFKRSFVYGNYIDEALLMTDSGDNDYYYVHDHLYSPAALTDDQGTVLERYEYDAYGKAAIQDLNHVPRATSLYDNPYLFTGRRLDILDSNSLKIQYSRNRYYDPNTGRFLTHDPLGYVDGMNLYEYVKSDPYKYLDPYGLDWVTPWNPPNTTSPRSYSNSRFRFKDKCVKGERDYEVLGGIALPHGPSHEATRKEIKDINRKGMFLGVTTMVQSPTPGSNSIKKAYTTTIMIATGNTSGWDLSLKIQEKKCVKRGCFRKKYVWKEVGKPFYYDCTVGEEYISDLNIYESRESARGAIPDCISEFYGLFDRFRDVDGGNLALWMLGKKQTY